MTKTRSIVLGALSFLMMLVLMTGCYRPAAPDVTVSPITTAEAVETEEAPPDMEATATSTAQPTAEDGEEGPAETPTELPPTPTPSAPSAAEPVTPAPPVSAPTSAPTGQVTHVVQPGENLFRIALRYGTTVQAIAQANGIANPRLIYVGQKLTIPSAGAKPPSQPSKPPTGEITYVVKPGDNLFRIALRYNMSYLYLAQYNGITNPSNIYVGQVLKIPPH